MPRKKIPAKNKIPKKDKIYYKKPKARVPVEKPGDIILIPGKENSIKIPNAPEGVEWSRARISVSSNVKRVVEGQFLGRSNYFDKNTEIKLTIPLDTVLDRVKITSKTKDKPCQQTTSRYTIQYQGTNKTNKGRVIFDFESIDLNDLSEEKIFPFKGSNIGYEDKVFSGKEIEIELNKSSTFEFSLPSPEEYMPEVDWENEFWQSVSVSPTPKNERIYRYLTEPQTWIKAATFSLYSYGETKPVVSVKKTGSELFSENGGIVFNYNLKTSRTSQYSFCYLCEPRPFSYAVYIQDTVSDSNVNLRLRIDEGKGKLDKTYCCRCSKGIDPIFKGEEAKKRLNNPDFEKPQQIYSNKILKPNGKTTKKIPNGKKWIFKK
jgi:hypothetical protein